MNIVLAFIFCLLICPVIARAETLTQRSLFVTVIQEPPVLSSREQMTALVNYARLARIHTLFVQVYRADQAWFPSTVGDQAPYNAALKAVGEDPLALLIDLAHKQGLEVHAWVNLLSLSKNINAPLLKKYGAGILTRNVNKKKVLADYKIDDQFFLEPGDLRVRAELLTMVEELLGAYPKLDGLQFDYIRYPDSQPHYGYTPMNRERFLQASGLKQIDDNSLAWKDWKRAQVTALLTGLVKRARSLHPGLKVSTTGCAPAVRALEEAFQDWPAWVNSGLIDFVTVMTYAQDTAEFNKMIADARARVSDPAKMNIAVGAYQQLKSPEVFDQQLALCQKEVQASCVIFHYGNLLESPVMKDGLLK
ncbi:MAG: family 10 glycosylhydrolase [Candidatus Omnitrophica bacterium]|nr:family 10 glycosylhydrolase [Candidatus Omnitrophota bacterium]